MKLNGTTILVVVALAAFVFAQGGGGGGGLLPGPDTDCDPSLAPSQGGCKVDAATEATILAYDEDGNLLSPSNPLAVLNVGGQKTTRVAAIQPQLKLTNTGASQLEAITVTYTGVGPGGVDWNSICPATTTDAILRVGGTSTLLCDRIDVPQDTFGTYNIQATVTASVTGGDLTVQASDGVAFNIQPDDDELEVAAFELEILIGQAYADHVDFTLVGGNTNILKVPEEATSKRVDAFWTSYTNPTCVTLEEYITESKEGDSISKLQASSIADIIPGQTPIAYQYLCDWTGGDGTVTGGSIMEIVPWRTGVLTVQLNT